jgi:trans-aconitate methyltransferase
VADLAGGVFALLAPKSGEKILDLGCGDGAMTERIAATGAVVTGVDVSAAMVAAARARGLKVDQESAESLMYEEEFDAVFSNAALHWISNAAGVLEKVRRALRPGGRFVAEMGGHGNIAAIRTALQAVFSSFGIDAERGVGSFFPSVGVYRTMLEEAGFSVQSIELIPRPTLLAGGTEGMRIWLNTFRNGALSLLPAEDRAVALERTIELLRPILADRNGDWTADYVRLRFHATT